MIMEKKLQRIPHEGAIGGVCAGLGEYVNIDKTWIRVIFVVSVFFSGYLGIGGFFGPLVYIILWIVLPVKPQTIPQDPFHPGYDSATDAPDATEVADSYAGWNPAVDHRNHKRGSKDRRKAGTILLIIGFILLLYQLDIFSWHDFYRYWPILIILAGLANIIGAFGGDQRRRHSGWDQPHSTNSAPTWEAGPKADNDITNNTGGDFRPDTEYPDDNKTTDTK